jgi:D-alanine-D-alanine ligase
VPAGQLNNKPNLGILLGGRSCEHEVSVVSARSVLEAIDHEKYNVYLIGIDKNGHWHLASSLDQLIANRVVRAISDKNQFPENENQVTLGLHHQGNLRSADGGSNTIPALDVIFPVLHGTFGEDGTIQGVFEMAGIPYVGCGVAASSIAMDKALAKLVFTAAGIPQAPSQIVVRSRWSKDSTSVIDAAETSLGFPAFVKPANMGSSVGVSKAHDRKSLEQAINLAFDFDNKIIVEQSMENCQEVECAVLGNEDPVASVVGEIIPGAEFYDYQTKYIDDKSETLIPAQISRAANECVRDLSIRAFKAIDGAGLARVDFFVNRVDSQVYLNEINTLPGFTPISMYPKLWSASGIAYPDLIDRLVVLAMEQHQSRASLKRAI